MHLLLRLLKSILYRLLAPMRSLSSVYTIQIGLPYLAQLRMGLCKLNYYKFKYNFKDTINPVCLSNDEIEDVEHVLLHCSSYLYLRRNLLARIYALIRPFGLANLSNEGLTNFYCMVIIISHTTLIEKSSS